MHIGLLGIRGEIGMIVAFLAFGGDSSYSLRTMPTYKDADVIKALFAYDAERRDVTGLNKFLVENFPGISKHQLNRCMEIVFTGPPSDPAIDAAAAKLANEALRKAGHDNLVEFLQEESDEANELLEKLKKLGERDSPKKLGH